MAGHRLLRDGTDNFTKVAVKLPSHVEDRQNLLDQSSASIVYAV